MPALSGRGLDGEPYRPPEDLHKRHSFIVAAFRRGQQALVDRWLPWLLDLERRGGDLAVYELPLLWAV